MAEITLRNPRFASQEVEVYPVGAYDSPPRTHNVRVESKEEWLASWGRMAMHGQPAVPPNVEGVSWHSTAPRDERINTSLFGSPVATETASDAGEVTFTDLDPGRYFAVAGDNNWSAFTVSE